MTSFKLPVTHLIRVLLFTLLLAACQTSTSTPTLSMPEATLVATSDTSSNTVLKPAVVVEDQTFDGTSVIVSDVVSAGAGWIAIHAQDNGSLGPAIGFAPVKQGDNRDVRVKIDASRATPVMYAMLHKDAGSIGAYEFPGPDEPEMVDGQMIAPSFKTTVGETSKISPLVKVVDQEIKDGTVKVDDVVSNGPGWIVIHTHVNGEPGSEIGHIAVKDGETRDVSVPVDVSKATAVMYAILYTDAGATGTFESPGVDTPVLENGQMIAPSFKATLAMTMTNSTQGMGMSTPDMAATIKVSDQEIQDGMVKVDEVVSNGPGWVVIYSQLNGEPDTAIGHTPIQTGENRDVMVQIDASKVTEVLYAMLHADSGAAGIFEFPGPDEPVMVGVKMIMAEFKSASTAAVPDKAADSSGISVKVADQVLRGSTVKIDEVVSEGPGWLGIHVVKSDGTIGSAIGFTSVKNGLTKDFIVRINLNQATKVMYAMLHTDKGEVGTLEFPGPDVPVTVHNQMVMTPFKITGGLKGSEVVIKIGEASGMASFLTDGQGMSLYYFLNDAPGKSNCDALCQTEWLPLLATGRLTAGTGVTASKLGVILLANGSRQVTYAGLPLYYYVGDNQAGDANGQGVEGLWYLSTP